MAFNKDIPAASTSLRVSNPQILENQESSQEALNNEHIFTGTDANTQTGDHTQGSARCFSAATAPAVRIDGNSFIVTDNGSLWMDTDNNALSIMTDYSQAIAADKWTLVSDEVIAVLLAANRVFAGTLGVDGNFEVGTGSEFTVSSAGAVTAASTLDVTGETTLTGGLASTTMSGVLAMGSNKITGLATGTSTGDAIHLGQFNPALYAAAVPCVFPNGLILDHGVVNDATTSGTGTFAASFTTAPISIQLTLRDTTPTAGNSIQITSLSNTQFGWSKSSGTDAFYWTAWGH